MNKLTPQAAALAMRAAAAYTCGENIDLLRRQGHDVAATAYENVARRIAAIDVDSVLAELGVVPDLDEHAAFEAAARAASFNTSTADGDFIHPITKRVRAVWSAAVQWRATSAPADNAAVEQAEPAQVDIENLARIIDVAKERELFEREHAGRNFSKSFTFEYADEYADPVLENLWKGWLKRAAHSAPVQAAPAAPEQARADLDALGWPNEIYLNAGDDEISRFDEYGDVTWCSLPQGASDIRYVRADAAPIAAAPTASTDDEDLLDVMDPPKAKMKREDWDPVTRKPKVASPASEQVQADAARDVLAEEWSYSTDEERYHDPEPSRLAILHHAVGELEDRGEDSGFWIGRNVRFIGKGDAGRIIEDLQEQAYDECGEYAETYLEDVTKDEEAELEVFVSDWAKRVDRSNFWTVCDTEFFTIEAARAEIERLESSMKTATNEGEQA